MFVQTVRQFTFLSHKIQEHFRILPRKASSLISLGCLSDKQQKKCNYHFTSGKPKPKEIMHMQLVQSRVKKNRRWNWIFWVSEQLLHCSQCLPTCLRLAFAQSLQHIQVHATFKTVQRGDLSYVT